MPADHFVSDLTDHVHQLKPILIRSDLSIQNYLQQDVAKFFLNGCVVVGIDRFQKFVGFFERVWLDRSQSLLTVPGTAFRSAEPRGPASLPARRCRAWQVRAARRGPGSRAGLAVFPGEGVLE